MKIFAVLLGFLLVLAGIVWLIIGFGEQSGDGFENLGHLMRGGLALAVGAGLLFYGLHGRQGQRLEPGR